MIDQILRISLMLKLNTDVLKGVIETAKKARMCEDSSLSTLYDVFEDQIQSCISSHEFLSKSADALRERSNALSHHVRLLSFFFVESLSRL